MALEEKKALIPLPTKEINLSDHDLLERPIKKEIKDWVTKEQDEDNQIILLFVP